MFVTNLTSSHILSDIGLLLQSCGGYRGSAIHLMSIFSAINPTLGACIILINSSILIGEVLARGAKTCPFYPDKNIW